MIWLHVLFNAFCSQSAKQGRKSAHNMTDRRVPNCASWILWQMIILFTPLGDNRRNGRPPRAPRLFSKTFVSSKFITSLVVMTVPCWNGNQIKFSTREIQGFET